MKRPTVATAMRRTILGRAIESVRDGEEGEVDESKGAKSSPARSLITSKHACKAGHRLKSVQEDDAASQILTGPCNRELGRERLLHTGGCTPTLFMRILQMPMVRCRYPDALATLPKTRLPARTRRRTDQSIRSSGQKRPWKSSSADALWSRTTRYRLPSNRPNRYRAASTSESAAARKLTTPLNPNSRIRL